MLRNIAIIVVSFIALASLAAGQDRRNDSLLDTVHEIAPEITARVMAAVVRIELRREGVTDALGVCISEDGYVLFRSTSDLRVRTPLPADRLTVRFSTGDHGNATVIGSSNEWGITLAKIDSGESWPSVPLKENPIAAGDPCCAVHCQRNSEEVG